MLLPRRNPIALFAATVRNHSPMSAHRLFPPAAYMKRGLLGIMEPAMATMKPGLFPLTTPGMFMSQERPSDWEH